MNDFIFEYNEPFYVEVDNENIGERVDKYLADMLSSFSRSQLQKLIKDGRVQCAKNNNEDFKPVKANYNLSRGISFHLLFLSRRNSMSSRRIYRSTSFMRMMT